MVIEVSTLQLHSDYVSTIISFLLAFFFLQGIWDLELESTVLFLALLLVLINRTYLLKMFEWYYRVHGHHIYEMASTGDAAHNINRSNHASTFEITSEDSIVDFYDLCTVPSTLLRLTTIVAGTFLQDDFSRPFHHYSI